MSNNITITFPDGNTKSVEKGISGFDLANQISKSLAKESVAIQIDGTICDLSLEKECMSSFTSLLSPKSVRAFFFHLL